MMCGASRKSSGCSDESRCREPSVAEHDKPRRTRRSPLRRASSDKSMRKVSKAETERREVMSKKAKRIAMILVGVLMALLFAAQHFGWIAGPPPLLAPGIQ
jgi:hypothetical protein